ncbi:MAG: helix-turn-helix transcriptional regulator [Coriobacteriales bacterium]|nr:helix-turn-helix transcriptional regulator [Coriobacteriales bacterium]
MLLAAQSAVILALLGIFLSAHGSYRIYDIVAQLATIVGSVLFMTSVFVVYATLSRYQTIERLPLYHSSAFLFMFVGIALGFLVNLVAQTFAVDVIMALPPLIIALLVASTFLLNQRMLFPLVEANKLGSEELVSICLEVCEHHALTQRQRDVLILAVQGLGTKEIADRLFISATTVRFHLHQVYRSLEVNTHDEMSAVPGGL